MVIKISMRILILSVFFTFACTNHNKNCFNKVDKGDYQGAIADCNKAIELDPKYTKAYGNRGIAKYELGDNQGAIADYNKAIELDPKNAKAYHNRGWAKGELGDNQGACLDWSKAGELGDSDAYKLINEYCNK